MLMSNGPAIITAAFPASELGKALGTLAMVVSAGLISGPSIGGILITHLGWRSVFLVNIPFGIAGFFVVRHFLPKDRHRPRVPFDWAGAFLQMIVILAIIVLVEPPKIAIADGGLVPIPRLLLAAVTFVFAAIFFKVETLAPAPILDMSLLQNRTFWTANVAGLLIAMAYSALTVLMPFYLEEVMRCQPDVAGLYMTAIPLMVFVIAPLSGRWSDRVGSRGLSGAGALIGAFGLFGMAGAFGEGLTGASSGIAIVVGLASMGLGTGLFQSPNNNAIMSAVPQAKLGVASALLATIRNLGLVLGTGLSMSFFSWRMHVTNDFVVSLHTTLFCAAFVGIGATIAAFGKRSGVHHFGFEDQKA
jgi:MFS family permease